MIGTPSIKHARKQSGSINVEYLNTEGQKVEVEARSFTLVRNKDELDYMGKCFFDLPIFSR